MTSEDKQQKPDPQQRSPQERSKQPERAPRDRVDQDSDQSFPASDPPGYTPSSI